MAQTRPIYPLSAVRALALYAQGLTTANGTESPPTAAAIYDTLERMGCVQIDTLQMVRRSQYLALWSRLGSYDPAVLDGLVYHEPRRLFEGWLHAACIIPLTEYRYQLPRMRRSREQPSRWSQQRLSQPGMADMLAHVVARIRQEGALRAADFEYQGPKRNSWWDWKPAKTALEYRFAWGDLMIAGRVNFQRLYDLRERVLPDWVDTVEPTRAEMVRHLLISAARVFGVCAPNQAADFSHEVQRGEARAAVEALIAEGVLVQVGARLSDGDIQTLMVHRESLPLLQQAADGALAAGRTTFLSPFDNLFWPQGRDEQLWGFRQLLEAYKPAAQREWGYFCLPILHRDRLVGRFDPKLERRDGVLRLKALYLEPGVEPDEPLVQGMAAAMHDFLAFHEARELVIERSQPAALGPRLLAAL
ncbi:MAG: winged helix-turn-helix domain-containing protein [Chloroflexota bacterium]